MKHVYSIIACLFLLLAGTSCEKDYRDLVLFAGVEPIYQVGTCSNLTSSIRLYLTRPDGIALGIDGGNGDYTLDNDNPAVAKAAFSEEVNGYRRIQVQPVGEGVANIRVHDGDGNTTLLKVTVDDCFKQYIWVVETGYICTVEDVDVDLWQQALEELNARYPMQPKGFYTLIPDDMDNIWGGGTLRVQTAPLASGFFEGTYDLVDNGEGRNVCRFRYNDEEHVFSHYPLGAADTRDNFSVYPVYEEVTSQVTVALPEGCRVYRVENWHYSNQAPTSDY